MSEMYRIEGVFRSWENEKFENFNEVFRELAEFEIRSSYKIIEDSTNRDVTAEFREYMESGGFVFGDDIRKETDIRLLEKIDSQNSYPASGFLYKGKQGVLLKPEYSQYMDNTQTLLTLGYLDLGYYDGFKIYCKRNNPDSPIYVCTKKGFIEDEEFEEFEKYTEVLAENIETFVREIEIDNKLYREEEDFPEIENLPERDRLNHFGEFIVDYKGESYPMLRFSLRGETFCYAAKWIAEKINEEQDFESDILKMITAFVDGKDYDALRELLFKTSDWNKIWKFCVRRGILCNFICYYFLDETEEFNGKEYPVVKFDYNGIGYVYTTEEAYNNEGFIEYLEDMNFMAITDATEEEIKKIGEFLSTGRLYSEFEKFCKENNILNIIPPLTINDRGFKFKIKEPKPPLPEGYSEEGEETLEVSEEEYKKLSQTLDRFLTSENPRWQKVTEVGEALAEFIEYIKSTSICGFVLWDIKTYENDSIKNYEFCKNNNALVHEQYRNVTKFQNVLRDANICSNSLYTDLLNIKDLSTDLMNIKLRKIMFDAFNELVSNIFATADLRKVDFELRGRYKIGGTGKPAFDRVSFTSLENVFDAIYVTDIKPPFKVLDKETGEDVTDKVMQIAEKEDYAFIDSEEIIKVLPKYFEKFKNPFGLKYIGDEDGKQISCMNQINFKNIIGFKSLWAKNCVPFGYKRNFVLFVDLNQSECPVYRIDYRKTADFETRKLLEYSAKDFVAKLSID